MLRHPQTKASLLAEQSLAGKLVDKWSCTLGKLPIRYAVDYAFLRDGEVVGFAELKCRLTTRTKYPAYMVSLHKVMASRMLYHTTNTPVVLVVEWTDAIGWTQIAGPSASEFRVGMGGRRDRNDDQDIEPVALISIDRFKGL